MEYSHLKQRTNRPLESTTSLLAWRRVQVVASRSRRISLVIHQSTEFGPLITLAFTSTFTINQNLGSAGTLRLLTRSP